ncbi:MAG TPA: POTRA domain-containing protein, partial [Anaeromyxobacter sp.]|nr:POTRA domain-containing protein [Anaeromyxobacter sp.]
MDGRVISPSAHPVPAPVPGGCRARAGRCLVALASLLLAARTLAQDPEPPPRVAAVDLALPAGDDEAAARSLLAVEPGAALSTQALRRTVQRLFQTGRYRNVVVRARPADPPPGEGGAWVRLVVEALSVRIVTAVSVAVEGERPALDEAALRDAAGIRVGETFEDGDLDAASARVRAALARRGWRSAQVA